MYQSLLTTATLLLQRVLETFIFGSTLRQARQKHKEDLFTILLAILKRFLQFANSSSNLIYFFLFQLMAQLGFGLSTHFSTSILSNFTMVSTLLRFSKEPELQFVVDQTLCKLVHCTQLWRIILTSTQRYPNCKQATAISKKEIPESLLLSLTYVRTTQLLSIILILAKTKKLLCTHLHQPKLSRKQFTARDLTDLSYF